MADKKISALTASATPLAGTEVLPIVQSGSTVKVAVSDLTTGRAVSMSGLTVTGQTASIGPGGTGAQNAVVTLNGSSASSYGPYFIFQRNSVSQWFVGTDSGINGGTSNDLILYSASNNLRLYNDVRAMNGNFVIGTAGKGIDFSANGGDVLSQYDEGVWTPVVTASAGAITSYTSSGRYTRVGRMVTAVLTFKLTNAGTASGAIIATLPFSTDAGITYIGCGRDDNLGSMLQGRVITAIPGSVYITTYANASIAVTNTEVFFTIQYFV